MAGLGDERGFVGFVKEVYFYFVGGFGMSGELSNFAGYGI